MKEHATSADALLTSLATDRDRGLSAAQAQERLARHGVNELTEAPPVPRWRQFLRQFQQLVIGILIVAALLSGLLREWLDALAILAIVLLNGILGFLQEGRAERALAALRKLSAPLARVLRDGILQTLPARELVPGDRIELEAGDYIPADARLIEAFGLRVQEAALTGESSPVDNDSGAELEEVVPLGDRRNMVYLGTLTAAGKASAVVVATGKDTELGRIAGLLDRTDPEPTPLQRRLTQLGRVLAGVCLAIVALIFILQVLRGGARIWCWWTWRTGLTGFTPTPVPTTQTVSLVERPGTRWHSLYGRLRPSCWMWTRRNWKPVSAHTAEVRIPRDRHSCATNWRMAQVTVGS